MNQLARLRPDKFDDKIVNEQISLIQQSCGENIDPDQIAIVFHECDYNMQKTIQRICNGEFEDSEWQTAKSTHKKKVHHHNEVITNGQHRLTTRTMNNNRSAKFDRKPPRIIDQPKQDKEKLLIKPKIIISSIPSEPVRMHSAVKYSSQPIDVQFGDIQWNDSIPQITQTDEFNHNTSPDSSSSSSSSNIVEETILTNESSITDNTISNLLSTDNTSHLSDQLTEPPSTINSDQQNQPIDIPITRLPPTSTPRMPEYPPQYIPTTTTTSYNTYSSLPANQWNMQTSNYRTNSKGNIHSSTSYQLPNQQQQQVFVGAYPYPTLSPTLVQVFAPIEHWSHNGYTAPIESYTYSTTNYITTYPNQPSQTKYDQQSYDKEHLNSTQPNKDTHLTSKLSPTAVAFSQGVPSTTALYINPIPFPMPSYYHPHHPSTSGLSMENHDNHSNTSNRTNYYQHAQTSRTYNTHVSNSTWHPQQSM